MPRYNLQRIVTVRDYLVRYTLAEFTGFAPTGPHFEDFVAALCDGLPRVDWQVMCDSVRDLAGVLLTEDVLRDTAWRLAGNISRLREGTPVPPWHNTQRGPEWMPAQIVSYQPARNKWGRPGGDFRFRILAGTACPMVIGRFMTKSYCRRMAREAGYTSQRHDYPLGHISELVNLRAWLKIDPGQCRPGIPGFERSRSSSGLFKWNRAIIKKRFRQGWVCPYDFDHHCHQCPVGYQDCPAAVHRETYHVEA